MTHKTSGDSHSKGARLARDVANFMNGADAEDVQSFVDELTSRTHRTLQQNSMKLFVACIRRWATTGENWYDLRNEATVKLSRKIVETCGDNLYLPLI